MQKFTDLFKPKELAGDKTQDYLPTITNPVSLQKFIPMRIIYMSTPEIGIPALELLMEKGYDIVGVVTATDKLGGRNMKQLLQSDIKKYAVEKGLRVLQPANLKDPDFLSELRALKADLQIVIAFRMLPEVVWNMPPLGTYNLHSSLLPKYRGAAPINWAIINGEKFTGVTSFKLKHEIDTGDVFLQDSLEIGEDETAGELYERIKHLAADVILKTVEHIEKDNVKLSKQEETEVSLAPKIFKEDCRIRWNIPTQQVYNHIRGLSPFPTAWTTLDGAVFKIFKAKKVQLSPTVKPGEILTDNRSFMHFATTDGYIACEEVQMEGKKRMDIRSFLNGYRISEH